VRKGEMRETRKGYGRNEDAEDISIEGKGDRLRNSGN
jgi:hypothetical protein